MPGFWETLNQNFQGTMDTYEKQKQDKRLRALQKLKFIMDSGDVDTPVSPDVEQEVADYAPEGQSVIQNGKYLGDPQQQRSHEFRKYITENPNAPSEDIMTRGMGMGAVTPAAYSSFTNQVENRASREELARQRAEEARIRQEDNQQHQITMRGLIEAGINGRAGGGDEAGTKAQRQKMALNRKTYLPYGGPYNYFTQHLLNSPEGAKAELATVPTIGQNADISSKDQWNQYLAFIMQNQDQMRDKFGMKDNELQALVAHIQHIANQRK